MKKLPERARAPSQGILRTQRLPDALRLTPVPLPVPRASAEVSSPDVLRRSAAVFIHTVLRAEHWLSPNGLLREWLRRWLLLAVLTCVPVFLFSPIIAVLLEHLTLWSASLLNICTNLAAIPGRIANGLFLVVGGVLLLRWLRRP